METPDSPTGPAVTPAPTSRNAPTRTSRILATFGVLLGGAYLLNPTLGFFELIPDNLPIIGNLDEAAATALVLYGLQHLGKLKSR